MVRHAALQHCCKLKSSWREPASDYVWISNEVLQAQWTRFSSSTTIRSHLSSRQSIPKNQTPYSLITKTIQSHLMQSYQNNYKNTGSFLQKRNGSAVPGPLEARKRRALRKHITGASHPDIFGTGLEFGAASLRGSLEQAGEGMKSRLERVYNQGSDLGATLETVWKWWSSNPQAPAKNEDLTITSSQRASIANSSFRELLAELDFAWTKTPENIHQLLQQMLHLESSDQERILQQTCSWIRTEVALGSMHEIDVKTILWKCDQTVRTDDGLTRLECLMHVCEAIGEGIASSAIRPAKDFDSSTTWLLFRSLACLSVREQILVTTLSQLLQSVAAERRNECIQLLQDLLGMTQFALGTRQDYTFKLLKILPKDISLAAVSGLCGKLARLSCSSEPQLRSRCSRQLKLLLIELSQHNLLADLHAQQSLEGSKQGLENNLFKLGMPHIVSYLETATEAKVCSFILRHVVQDFRWANAIGDEDTSSTTLMSKDAFPHDHTYASLLQYVTVKWPHKVRGVIRFLYTYLRECGRAEECYNLSRYVFSKSSPGARPSVEFLHGEISQWAKVNPLFAVLLLATDPRPGSDRHPVVTSAIANLSEGKALPEEVVPTITKIMIKRYGPDLDAPDPTSKAPMAASKLLQLLLQPMVWGDLPEAKAFRLFQKVLTLLTPVSHTLKRETAAAALNLVAVKSLESRRRVPRRKLAWLAQVVTCLEGPETWQRTADRIEHWWSIIEAEEDLKK